MQKAIYIKGAKEHNLKNIDVTIPRDKFVVVTGVSGSGKSSLAFDTIYAEGQRRYVESLSAYARQFLEQMQKPDVEAIDGLPPTIAIEQRTGHSTPRSIVATSTEIYDYLRLLFARIGKAYCYKCGKAISQQTPQQMVDNIMCLKEGTKLIILAPLVTGKKGLHKDAFDKAKREGFVRVRVDGKIEDLKDMIVLDKNKKHSIEVVVDRLVLAKKDIKERLSESIETALKVGSGLMLLLWEQDGKWHDKIFSELYACPHCGVSYGEIQPRLFSFNSPYGACVSCDGLGTKLEIDLDLIIPDKNRRLRDGAIEAWRRLGRRMTIRYGRRLRAFCEDFKVSYDTPFSDLDEERKRILLHGTTESDEKRWESYFEGVVPSLLSRFEKTESEFIKHRILSYMSELPCPDCRGKRLKPEALSIKIAGKNIYEVTKFTIEDGLKFFKDLRLTKEEEYIAKMAMKEVTSRLKFLVDVGLGYITLDRHSATLSGGEAQRIRLASQVGSGLVGVCYVLDEPTIGLHQKDNKRLLATLGALKDLGNTVIVVEHDEETMTSADHIIDMGIGAGNDGGKVVAQGTLQDITASEESVTGQYLSGRKFIPIPKERHKTKHNYCIEVRGAEEHNLKAINVKFPLGCFICVTGVSGSGKSTLVDEILYPALIKKIWENRNQKKIKRGKIRLTQIMEAFSHSAGDEERQQISKLKAGKHKDILGVSNVDKVIVIDQSPIGRTPRSNPATYTGLFTLIREIFEMTKEAKARGYKSGRFSFNVKGGRCEACEGQGTKIIEMHFLPDVYVTCEVCKGERYNRETLEVKYKGATIADVLKMQINEATTFFANFPKIVRILETLNDVGLGYMALGQASTTLSGGEAQRIKLASELCRPSTSHTLYILDEPTTGLHFDDINKLLGVLNRLVNLGNTVIVIEHNLHVIKFADWIIDLGPEGGDAGGKVIATGTPEEVAENQDSYTGKFLRQFLNSNHLKGIELENKPSTLIYNA